jgi:peptidoglycan/LPS O-acetylase OafA/YrhL
MSRNQASQSTAYRPDIDGLRAVAVLSVVFYHANIPGFSGGFAGVDIFFVISGYLITRIVWHELQEGRFSLTNFYARRVRRIFPALFAMLAVCSVAAGLLLIPSDLKDFGRSLSATVLFYSNYNFIKVGYFDSPAIESPLLHTWSLSVEEQFYAVWPILLFFLTKFIPHKRILPAIIILVSFSFVLSEYKIIGDHQRDAFYLPLYRGWELLMGATLAIAPMTFLPGRLAEALSAGGLAAIVLASTFYSTETPFPGLHAALPCAGAALLIATGQASTRAARLLSLRPLQFMGLISYSLYLIHWPLFSLAQLYINGPLAMPHRIVMILVSIVLAYLSWKYVETPFRRPTFYNKTVFVRAAIAFSFLYSIGAFFQFTNGVPFRVDQRILAIENLRTWDYSQYCRTVDIPGVRDGDTCELGDTSRGSFDFIIWGDSHASHYVPAIDTLAKTQNLHGVLFSRPSCPPFLADAGTYKECRRLNGSVVAWLQERSVRFALLAAHWTFYSRAIQMDLDGRGKVEGGIGLSVTLTELDKLKVAAIVLDEVPEFEQNIRLCAARELMQGRSYERCLHQPEAVFLAHHKPVDTYFEHLGRRHAFSIATPLRALCDGETCHAVVNGEIMIRDKHHLTPAGALHVMPYLYIPGLSAGLVARAFPEASRNEEIVGRSSPGGQMGEAGYFRGE